MQPCGRSVPTLLLFSISKSVSTYIHMMHCFMMHCLSKEGEVEGGECFIGLHLSCGFLLVVELIFEEFFVALGAVTFIVCCLFVVW